MYTLTLNARNVKKGVEEYFNIMSKIYMGNPEIGIATRDAIEACPDFDCMQETWSATQTAVPMYLILAGTKDNQGVVVSKSEKGIANIRTLDDKTWYLLQTNDDHFAGVCQQRCVDGNAHMQAIGQENISMDTLLNQVLLQSHNFNKMTIYTTLSCPAQSVFNGYGFDTDMPYVAATAPDLW